MLFIVLTSTSAEAQDSLQAGTWKIKGYLSYTNSNSFDSIQNPWSIDNQFYNRLNINYFYKDFKLDAAMRNRLIYGNSMLLIPDYAHSLSKDQGILDLSWNLIQEKNLVFNAFVDRLNLQYKKEHLEIQLGRQRINWGMTFVWNPNDIFNSYSYFDFDYEEKPGSDAIRINYYTGPASSVEIAAKLDSAGQTTAALKWLINHRGYDLQLIGGIMNQTDYVAGFAWAGNIKQIGFKGEASYFIPFKKLDSRVLEASISLDYAFPNNLYLLTQVLYCDFGSNVPMNNFNEYYSSTLNAKYLSFTDWNLFAQLSYPINPLVSLSAAGIYYPGIHGYFIHPMLTYNISENLDAALLLQYFRGEFPDALGDTHLQQFNFAFFRLKWSF
ncbi:MAG: hypothetical protein K9I34_03260 [Bacteroidales bacterium]|nr:hypothetical protein [Bacteroidales bacterium]